MKYTVDSESIYLTFFIYMFKSNSENVQIILFILLKKNKEALNMYTQAYYISVSWALNKMYYRPTF